MPARTPSLPLRLLLAALVPALALTTSCGDSESSPTSPGFSTLSGTVIRGTSASGAQTYGMPIGLAGLTVRHAASGSSTQTSASGAFTLTGLPSGSVELEFERADIHARGRVSVRAGTTTTVTIAIVGSSAVVAPSGHAGEELEGLVSANDGSTLTVLDQRLGAVVVHTDGSTLVRSGDSSIPLSQIQVGQRVHVKALQQEDETYLATEVRLQGDKVGGSRHVSGSVVSVDAGARTFVVDGGAADVEIETDSGTSFKRRGGNASFSDLAAGISVEVNGILQGDGTVLARKITIES